MKAPIGANVSLYYDGPSLHEGDYLTTPTGRSYRVTSVRVQQRGQHAGRQHLRVDVVPVEEAIEAHLSGDPEGPLVRDLAWYPRGRSKKSS